VATASASEQSRRRDILDAAWTLVRDKHYDKTLGGVDWTAIRARYEPRALAAPSEATFYRVLNDMIGELGQAHMLVVGPGSEDDLPGEESVAAAKPASVGGPPPTPTVPEGAPRIEGAPGIAVPEAASAAASPAAAPPAGAPSVTSGGHDSVGDPGLTIRSIEGKPVVTAIRAGSSASRSALRLGYVITAIAGRPLADATRSRRPLRPAEERFAIRRAAAHRLEGAAGTKVTVAYLDANDRPGQVVLEREAMAGVPVEIGNLPPIYPNTQSRMMGDVGVVSFNFFLLSPVLADVQKAIARFRAAGVKAIILDVRGNPGGQGAMAIPIAAAFVREPLTLGSIQFRDFTQTLTARPSLDVTPFLGPLVSSPMRVPPRPPRCWPAVYKKQSVRRSLVRPPSVRSFLRWSPRFRTARSCSTWWRTSVRPRASCWRIAASVRTVS